MVRRAYHGLCVGWEVTGLEVVGEETTGVEFVDGDGWTGGGSFWDSS